MQHSYNHHRRGLSIHMSRAAGMCERIDLVRWKSSLSLGIRRIVHLLLKDSAPASWSFGCALRALNCVTVRCRNLREEVSFLVEQQQQKKVNVYVDIISFMSRSLHFNCLFSFVILLHRLRPLCRAPLISCNITRATKIERNFTSFPHSYSLSLTHAQENPTTLSEQFRVAEAIEVHELRQHQHRHGRVRR